MKPPIIDCDAPPFVPNDMSLVSHRCNGQLVFDAQKIELWLSPEQQGIRSINGVTESGYGRSISSGRLHKLIADLPTLNANVLDFLLENTGLIPPSWKTDTDNQPRYVYFWGTIYAYSDSVPLVRYLYWHNGCWQWLDKAVAGRFDDEWDPHFDHHMFTALWRS